MLSALRVFRRRVKQTQKSSKDRAAAAFKGIVEEISSSSFKRQGWIWIMKRDRYATSQLQGPHNVVTDSRGPENREAFSLREQCCRYCCLFCLTYWWRNCSHQEWGRIWRKAPGEGQTWMMKISRWTLQIWPKATAGIWATSWTAPSSIVWQDRWDTYATFL